MEKKPFGCLTAYGLVSVALTVFIVLAVWLVSGGILFSPGSLNAQAGVTLGAVTSHADLGGRCSACHSAFWRPTTMADNCVLCHQDVVTQRLDPAKLHGNLLVNNPDLTCRICHPDHRGPDASLTDLSRTNIVHNTFGYSLSAHQVQVDGSSFSCDTCHGNDYNRFDQAVCAKCHLQIKADFMTSHLQDYGEKCLACHDGIDSYGHNFNHAKVAFQLTGMHANIACGTCHAGARSIANMKATPKDCSSCHAKDDVHKGQFGNGCGACHTTNGWLPATFDHSLSKFPLTGAHFKLTCAQCHASGVFTGLSTACSSCHPDPSFHTGLFKGEACDQCHTTSAWTPATFNGTHPGGCGERNCINHEGATCLDCHTVNLSAATCLKCHDSNTPGERGGGG
jgi:hypothetical protein